MASKGHDLGTGATESWSPDRESPPAASPLATEVGTRIGRYTVLERVGAGATGVVFSAYDPKLDRRVALKVVRAPHRRSQREALAMARLDDANVITIYDVGDHQGQPFLTMEFADGGTVAAWLATRPAWREVLSVFERAGRGLWAVHRAGLVHRDFKPANILMFKSGEVRVTDFGLARAADDLGESDEGDPPGSPPPEGLAETVQVRSSSPVLNTPMTLPGDVLGTPLYMAPEQHRGEPATAISDQFAFAVALFEGLYGHLPFAGATRAELIAAVERGVPSFPARSPVPGSVRRALARALAVRPEQRFPSMGAFLAALALRRRRVGLALGGAAALAGLALFAAARPRPDACATPALAPDDVWNQTRRANLRAGLLATGLPYAEAASNGVIVRLDAWAGQLRAVEHEVCQARAPAYPAQLACLREGKTVVNALLEVLARPDSATVGRAVAAAQEIPAPQTCVRALPERAGQSVLVQRARQTLAMARVLTPAGRHQEGAALARVAIGQAHVAGDERSVIGGLTLLGRLELSVDPRRSLPLFEEAAWRAVVTGDDRAAVSALLYLITVGNRLPDFPAARRYTQRALALLARTPDDILKASVLQYTGETFQEEDHPSEALAAYIESRTLRERLLPPMSLDLASSYHQLGNFYFAQSRFPEARAAHERALEIRLAALGPWHSKVAGTYTNLGAVAYGMGDFRASAEHHRHALAIYAKTLAPDSLDVGLAHYNLAGALFYLGDYDQCLAEYLHAREIYTLRLGAETDDVVEIVADIADVHAIKGRMDEALAGYREALAGFAKLGDVDGKRSAGVRVRRGRAFLDMGRVADAYADADASVRSYEKVYGPQHIDLATALQLRGETELALGRRAEGVASLERAVAIREALPADRAELDAVRALLAKAKQPR